MIDQTPQNPTFVKPLFCFQMKGSIYFIIFSVFLIILHSYIPILTGIALHNDLTSKAKGLHVRDHSPDMYEYGNTKIEYHHQPDSINDMSYVPKYVDNIIDYKIHPQTSYKYLNSKISNSINRILTKSQSSSHYYSSFKSKDKDPGYIIPPGVKYDMPSPILYGKQGSFNAPVDMKYVEEHSYPGETQLEDELELSSEQLIFIFVSCQQLFMVCFISLCLILFCVKSNVTNCMTFTFSVSNLINSIIYLLIFLFFFAVIIYDEFSDGDNDDLPSFLLVTIPFGIIYSFNIFWSALLLKVSKTLVPGKGQTEQTALVQENMA